jgi:hypothetical protein
MMSNVRIAHGQQQTIGFLRVNIRTRSDAVIQKTRSTPKSKVIAIGDELAMLRNAQWFILEGLNLLGNCVLGEPSEVGEVILPTVQQVRRGARHVSSSGNQYRLVGNACLFGYRGIELASVRFLGNGALDKPACGQSQADQPSRRSE